MLLELCCSIMSSLEQQVQDLQLQPPTPAAHHTYYYPCVISAFQKDTLPYHCGWSACS